MGTTMTEVLNPNDPEFTFWCPGCGIYHWFKTTGDHPTWTWNGDMRKPTVNPSILVRYPQDGQTKVCHFFMREGKIQYLDDCTHDLRGKTVDMEDDD